MSQAPGPEGKIAPRVWDETAAGGQAEFLVVLQRQADLSGAGELAGKREKGRFVYAALTAVAETAQAPIVAQLRADGLQYRQFTVVNAILVRGDRQAALGLAGRPDVARLEANPRVRGISGSPGDFGPAALPEGIGLNVAYVGAPGAWAVGATGQGMVVGAQDTGYDWTHPALKAQYRGWDGQTASHDYNWHDAVHVNEYGVATCGTDAAAPCDDWGHGTHTLGTAVGWDGGANQIGVAPGARWIGCRNMDYGHGTPASYLECFDFFLAPYPIGGTIADGNPDLAPDVTLNSWSCPPEEGCGPATLQAAAEAMRAAGILTVAAATNSGPDCSTVQDPPAIYSSVLTVGALVSGTDTAASFSSRGPVTIDGSGRMKPDIMAPGTGVRSSIPGGGYAGVGWNGTSMAAPHVAGGAALIWSAAPWLRGEVTATTAILLNSAVPIGSTACSSVGVPNNTYGHGRLDLLTAVEAARPVRLFFPFWAGQ